MTQAMVDTETLGKKPGCAILSLGAAIFDPRDSGYGMTFHRTICLTSSVLAGFYIDAETVQWWQDKSEAAKLGLSFNTSPIQDVLSDFRIWCELHGVEQVWCQGATFDAPILGEAYDKVGQVIPWKFFNVRDTRTVYDLCEFDQYSLPREGTFHNALDDAIHQIKCVQAALAKASDTDMIAANIRMKEALEKLARLGNGGMPGNSEGNWIAQEALGMFNK